MKSITKIEATMGLIVHRLRVAVYARVSTSSDEQLLSLEAQKQHYEQYINDKPDWDFAGIYFDEGISGTKTTKRDDLKRLLDDCKAGKIDKIITKSISRFARNTADCLEMVRTLQAMNVSIYFEKENIDTGLMNSELMLSILSSIAESESRSISGNTKWSIKNRFENGEFIVSTPPYGYRNQDKKMMIDEEEAAVIKEIFAMTVNGFGCHKIAQTLNNRKIKTRKGKQWHPSTIQQIIKNETYTGDLLLQKTYTDKSFNRHVNYGEKNMYLVQDHHPSIISKELFERAQEAVARRAQEKGLIPGTEKYQSRYCFSQKIICGECGSVFKRCKHQKPDYILWACQTHLRDKHSCSLKAVKDEEIKAAFIRMMCKLHLYGKEIMDPFIYSLRGYDNKEKLLKIHEIDQRIEDTTNNLNVLDSLMTAQVLENNIYLIERKNLLFEAKNLQQQREAIANDINGDVMHLNEAQILAKLISRKDLPSVFDEDMFLQTVDTITIHSQDSITFNLKCGLHLEERLVHI